MRVKYAISEPVHNLTDTQLALYELFCRVLYVLRGGIQWRMVPSDFPKWRSVYAYWQKWGGEQVGGTSVLDMSLKELVDVTRQNHGRREKASLCIVDTLERSEYRYI